MRRTGPWQRDPDDRILEFLRESPTPATVSEVAAAIPGRTAEARRRFIANRLRVLAQADYVEPEEPDRTRYDLTVWGRLYLEGEVAADLLVPEPDARRPGYVLG